MEFRKYGQTYYIRMDTGDEVIGSLLAFCREEEIASAVFSGIGGSQRAEVQIFHPESGEFETKELTGTLELVALNGNVISDEHKLNANSVSAENNDRTTRITFRLLGTGFERTVDYWLTVTDLEDSKELYRIPFKIDVVFGLDFGF